MPNAAHIDPMRRGAIHARSAQMEKIVVLTVPAID